MTRPVLLPTALLTVLVAVVPARAEERRDVFAQARWLGRGINLGNALEAPREGAWGLTIKDEHFVQIRKAGFNSVRIPIRWSAHAGKEAPYRIDAAFFQRIDHVMDKALKQELALVLNVHHYEELYANPEAHRARFVALWQQIAARYRDRPDRLFFELLNEPHGKLTDALWNGYLGEALKAVRATNPDRAVIVGPGAWNNVDHLKNLQLPADDQRLVVTVHYYKPMPFTHQGARWVKGSETWLGTRWEGNEREKEAVRKDLDVAAQWARTQKRPLYLGEFGAYEKADIDSRARWTRFVREQAEVRSMAWAYWEFASGFGAYERKEQRWREPLLNALVPR
jgi:endoglucanase